jgi:hypothetical protein
MGHIVYIASWTTLTWDQYCRLFGVLTLVYIVFTTIDRDLTATLIYLTINDKALVPDTLSRPQKHQFLTIARILSVLFETQVTSTPVTPEDRWIMFF